MSHVRRQIRTATVDALAGIATVYASRTLPIDPAVLPAICVYTNDEQLKRSTMSDAQRDLDLIVEVSEDGTAVDDALDALLVAIESVLNDSTLGGLCKPLALTSISVSVDTGGSTPIGRARLVYRAVYFTDRRNPELSI